MVNSILVFARQDILEKIPYILFVVLNDKKDCLVLGCDFGKYIQKTATPEILFYVHMKKEIKCSDYF